MTKARDYREMTEEQLEAELRQTQQDLFHLRFQSASERLDAPSNLKKLRRDIARIKTIQHERLVGAAEES